MPEFDIMSVLVGLRAAKLASYPTDKATGDPASFPDGANDAPVKSVKLSAAATQEGSGDPSPSNLRPIVECREVKLYHSGADTTDYETITVSLQSKAGPAYGGTADAVAGVFAVDRVLVTLDGTMSWSNYSSGGQKKGFLLSAASAGVQDAMTGSNSVTAPYVLCSLLPNSVGHSTWTRGYCGLQNKNIWFGFTDEDFESLSAFKLYANEHPIQMVIPIDEPFAIPISAQQIRALYGENNFWADEGDVEVEYRADLELYIEKQLNGNGSGALGLGSSPGSLGSSPETPEPGSEDTPEDDENG